MRERGARLTPYPEAHVRQMSFGKEKSNFGEVLEKVVYVAP